MDTDYVDDEALAFFNQLSGVLVIQVSEQPHRIAPNLLNLAVSPQAKLVSLSFELAWFDEKTEEERELTPEQLDWVVLRSNGIRMRSILANDVVVEHPCPNSEFRVKDLAEAVRKTELASRSATDWFGGIDVHHIYFAGIVFAEDGVWVIHWGS